MEQAAIGETRDGRKATTMVAESRKRRREERWAAELIVLFSPLRDRGEAAVLRSCNVSRGGMFECAIPATKSGLWEIWLDPENPDAPPRSCLLSDGFKALLGFAPGEMPDSLDAFRERLLPVDRSRMDRKMREHLRGKSDHLEMEYQLHHRDGSVRWFLSCGRVLRDELGRPSHWVGFDWEASEGWHREEELELARKRYATLFHRSPVPMALATYPEGRFLELDQGFLRITARNRLSVVGGRDLGIWCDATERARGFDRRLRDDGMVRSMRVGTVTAAGEERAVEISAERVELEGRECVLLACRDLTADLAIEERLVDPGGP